jgi:hypothetical protein
MVDIPAPSAVCAASERGVPCGRPLGSSHLRPDESDRPGDVGHDAPARPGGVGHGALGRLYGVGHDAHDQPGDIGHDAHVHHDGHELVLPLCHEHLVAAYERVAADVGVTDALPGPCAACGSRLGVRYPSGWLCAVCEWRWGEVPEGNAAVRVDVVYYLRWRDRIKIGTSANPRGRLAQLRHDELLAFERGDRTLEQRRHREFATSRLGGEWFAADDALIAHVAQVAAGVDDPWSLLARWRSEAAALAG